MNSNIINQMNLPKISFSVTQLQTLYKDASLAEHNLQFENKTNNKYIECYNPVIDYIQLYYFEVSNSKYYFYDVDKDDFIYTDNKDFITSVLNKIGDKYINSKFTKNDKIYSYICKINKPRVFKENSKLYINAFKGFLHKSYKPYTEYAPDVKLNVKKMLDFILDVTCSSDTGIYEAYIKYLSQICKGLKTEVIIYKKSAEGCGKSTESNFIMNWVLGKELCIIAGSEPLTTAYNKCLLGKLFVIFEELPTFSQSQWSGISSKLKTYCTETMCSFQDKYEKTFEAENISNYVINTNVESLKDSDGRRIIIMPLSTKYMGNFEFFGDIRNSCYNLEVGEAFYSYMLEIDTNKFYSQRDFPESENKRLVISNLLPGHIKFLKEQYVLKEKSIKQIKPKDLYALYIGFCTINDFKPLMKNQFCKKLEELDIHIEKHSSNYYQVPLKKLKELAEKYKWICKYDEIESESDVFIDTDRLDAGVIIDFNLPI